MHYSDEYTGVADMFRHLKTLDRGSVAHQKQRASICHQCLPLADHIARRYRNRGESHDDLVQVARVGLMNAMNRFDVDKGVEFSAFAVPTMMGEVRRHFRDRGWAVKVPRPVKEVLMQVNRITPELTQRLGRAPTASEIAERLGIDREQVIQAVVAGSNYSTLSTDAPTQRSDTKVVGDHLGGDDAGIEKMLQVETLRPLIAALPERERKVLTLRFFEEMTQGQIADRMGYSQMHVSRILAKALATLRTEVREPALPLTG